MEKKLFSKSSQQAAAHCLDSAGFVETILLSFSNQIAFTRHIALLKKCQEHLECDKRAVKIVKQAKHKTSMYKQKVSKCDMIIQQINIFSSSNQRLT